MHIVDESALFLLSLLCASQAASMSDTVRCCVCMFWLCLMVLCGEEVCFPCVAISAVSHSAAPQPPLCPSPAFSLRQREGEMNEAAAPGLGPRGEGGTHLHLRSTSMQLFETGKSYTARRGGYRRRALSLVCSPPWPPPLTPSLAVSPLCSLCASVDCAPILSFEFAAASIASVAPPD